MPEADIKKDSPFARPFMAAGLILIFPLLILIGLVAAISWCKARYWIRPQLLRQVRKEWLPHKKSVLFVYSDSDGWKQYAEEKIIPRLGTAAVVLNWSQRRQWINSGSLAARLFKNFQWGRSWIWLNNARQGGQEYNHLAIVFRRTEKPHVINFWPAFKDHEFGHDDRLQEKEQELYSYLEQ